MAHTDKRGRTWHIMEREDGACLYYTRPDNNNHFVVFDPLDGDDKMLRANRTLVAAAKLASYALGERRHYWDSDYIEYEEYCDRVKGQLDAALDLYRKLEVEDGDETDG